MKTRLRIATLLAAAMAFCPRAGGAAAGPPSQAWESYRTALEDISTLRATGRYADALAAARSLERALPADCPDFRRRDTRRLVGTLRFILALGPQQQKRLARADSTDLILESLIARERCNEALDGAVEQMATRAELLGPDHAETLASLCWIGRTVMGARDLSLEPLVDDYLLARIPDVYGADHPLYAETLIRQGRAARVRQETQLALDDWEQGLRILDPVKDEYPGLVARARMGQAWYHLYLNGGQLERAIELQRESVRVLLGNGARRPGELGDAATWLCWLLFQGGHAEEAMEYGAMAESAFAEDGLTENFDLGVVSALVAGHAMIAGDWERAALESRVAATSADASRRRQFPGYSRAGSPLHQYESLAYCQLELGRFDDAWRSLQMSKAAILTDFMHLARMRHDDPETARMIDRLEVLDERYERQIHDGYDPSVLDALIRKLRAQTALFDRQLRYLDSRARSTVSVADIQAHLRPGEAYVGWVTTEAGFRQTARVGPADVYFGTWGYVIRPGRPIVWVPLFETRNEQDVANRTGSRLSLGLLQRMSGWPVRMGDDPEFNATCRKAARQIFDPLVPYLDGIHTLVVEVSEPLRIDLPTELLILEDGKTLGERFATCYVPSGESFVMMADRPSHRSDPGRTALVMGDPVYSRDQLNAPTGGDTRIDATLLREALAGNEAALSHLPRLPKSRMEVERIGELLSSPPLMGADASEARINGMIESGRLGTADVVHIAAHALIGQEIERSALALSRLDVNGTPRNDGLVNIDEIMMTWTLNADLVSLSGCQTAYSFRTQTGELVGFTQALIGAGARSVLGSHWKVDDEAAERLMVRFYEDYTGNYDDLRDGRRGEPMGKAEALHEARTWLRAYTDENGNRPFINPVYWSGFVIVGTPD